jgi:hypothetical protein
MIVSGKAGVALSVLAEPAKALTASRENEARRVIYEKGTRTEVGLVTDLGAE